MAAGNDRILLFLSYVALLVQINNGSSNGLLPDGTKPSNLWNSVHVDLFGSVLDNPICILGANYK